MITLARVGDRLTCLDTTQEVTPYGLLLYQLRNKEAVVASDDAEGGVRRTPVDSPINTFMRFSLDGKFSEYGALDASWNSRRRVTATGLCVRAIAMCRSPAGRILRKRVGQLGLAR